MDNRQDAHPNPYDRQYFGDPNMLRQQMGTFGMHQESPHGSLFGVTPHQLSQMFSNVVRCPETQDHPTSRSSTLPSPSSLAPLGTTSTNPWMLPYSSPGVMNPEFSMGMSGLYQPRWGQEQNQPLSAQHRDSRFLSSQFSQENPMHAMHQREAQLREAQLRESQLREAQLQRDREVQMQREQELQIQRERESQLQWEQEAQLQHERKVQLQREREVQLQREREAQLQKEQEVQLHKEREAQIQRGLRGRHYLPELPLQQQHSSVQSIQHSNLTIPSPHDTAQQLHFQSQQDMNSLITRTSMPSLSFNSFNRQTSEQEKTPITVPMSMPSLNKQLPSNNSLIHFPQSLAANNLKNEDQWGMSSSDSSNYRKNFSSLEDSLMGSLDSTFREKNMFSSQFLSSNQLMKNLDDIDLTIDRHISPIKLDRQEKESDSKQPITPADPNLFFGSSRFGDILADQSSSFQQSSYQQHLQTAPSSQDAIINFNQFLPNQIAEHNKSKHNAVPESPTLSSSFQQRQQQQQQQQGPQQSTNPPMNLTQSNSVQVTQNSAVNININISMPSHPNFPYGLNEQGMNNSLQNIAVSENKNEISTKDNSKEKNVNSTATNVIQETNNDYDNMLLQNKEIVDVPTSMVISTVNTFKTAIVQVSTVLISSNSDLQTKRTSKLGYSSIASFLGLNTETNTKCVTSKTSEIMSVGSNAETNISENKAISTSSLELARNVIEQQDRISVIKPVAAATRDEDADIEDNKTLHTSLKKIFSATSKENHEAKKLLSPPPKELIGRPVHPSMRFKNTQRNGQTVKPVVIQNPSDASVKETEAGRPLHPSLRLNQNKPLQSPVDNHCLIAKSLRYQSELPDTVALSKECITPIRGGKPASYSVQGGKPAGYSLPSSGKPSSFTASLSTQKKNTSSGKPLSYLKSLSESSKSSDQSLPVKKKKGRPKRSPLDMDGDKEAAKQRKTIVKKPEQFSLKKTGTDVTKSKVDIKGLEPSVKKAEVNLLQTDSDVKKTEVGLKKMEIGKKIKAKIEANASHVVKLLPDYKKQVTISPPSERSGPIGGKTFAQFKGITFDGSNDKESSDSDSDSDSSSTSEDSSSKSESEQEDLNDTLQSNDSHELLGIGKKRKATADVEVIASLKKRKIVDEELIKIPLQMGWRRQTKLRPTATGEGLRGDVYYYPPCGKKLRTYPELSNYMAKNDIKDIKLEYFSFSTKLNVGEFLEAKQGSQFEPLTQQQIEERFSSMKEKARLMLERATERKEKKRLQNEKTRRLQEEKLKKKQDMLALKKIKEQDRKKVQVLIAEKKRAKEKKEKERLSRLEKQKKEKEWKQQALENAKLKKNAQSKQEEAVLKAKEREMKRMQLVMNKAQEKEKRKHELIMMKAYEAQRRAEERERLKEQKQLEKTLIRQRKLEQKRYERLISRELKKPIDDMALKDVKPLPSIPPVACLNIPGKAYADLLMVQEFIHSFGHVIDIDPNEDFPGMADLQAALLCEESSDEDALFNACQSLLFYALYDPGISGKYATTALGVNLQNVELNESNISEVVRLFILSRNEGKSSILSDLLADKPLVSLSPVNKAAVLAFMCNELLCGKAIGREIENSLDNMSNLRRDKWTLEGQMRKLKVAVAKKNPKAVKTTPSKKPLKTSETPDVQNTEDGDRGEEDEKDSDEEKDSDDEISQEFNTTQDDTDDDADADAESDINDPVTVEQMEKKLRLMEKKHARYRNKLIDASHTIRGIHLGQDRYRRRYYVLPNAGGVFVEGLESGSFDEEMNLKTEAQKEETKEKLDSLLTTLTSPKTLNKSVLSPVKTEILPVNSKSVELSLSVSPSGNKLVNPVNMSIIIKKDINDDQIKQEHSLLSPTSKDIVNTSPKTVLSPVSGGMSTSRAFLSPTLKESVKSPTENLAEEHLSPIARNMTSPTSLGPHTPTFKGPLSPTVRGVLSPTLKSPLKKSSTTWFSLTTKEKCEELKSTIDNSTKQKFKDIIPPNVRLLGQDRIFLESIYTYYSHANKSQNIPYNNTLNLSQTSFSFNTPSPVNTSSSLLGLPPGLDINLLIQQDPQKAAELLEIQTAVPQEITDIFQQGWWRIIDPEQLQRVIKAAHPRGMRERSLQKTVTRYMDYATASCKNNSEAFSLVLPDDENEIKGEVKVTRSIVDEWYPQLAYASDKSVLIEVEELEEKVFSASLQVKGWRLSQKISPILQLDVSKEYKPKEGEHPLHISAARLLALEAGIERRYMKHPFRVDKLTVASSKNESSDTSKDENLRSSNVQATTPALLLWREAVTVATSSAQLSMCINMLNDCIGWEKSIMKVFCILCRKSDNEELLLLCDACDCGCHTYCCKPKLEAIPDGDWFCQECVLMASGSDQCYSCKGKTDKRLKCAFCPRYYHMSCLEPPLQKTPRSPWACPVCKKARAKTKAPAKKKPRVEEIVKRKESCKSKFSNSRQQSYKDMEPCRHMLSELENHDLAWPFLIPVNNKQFPEYYKVIPHPMDFHTMKIKLRDFQYKNREEFIHDVRLVFKNCKTFNEDDSEVGRAGKFMSQFFEKRWQEILTTTAVREKKAKKDKQTVSEKQETMTCDKQVSSDDDDDDDDSSSSDMTSSESESSEVEEDSEDEEEERKT